jgi:hypothetical protein
MTRLLARALGCAIFGALTGAAAMILLSGLDPRFTLEMTQNRPGLLRGFYPGERDGALTFAWTAGRAEMPLAGLDRNVPWRARIRVRGGRRDPSTLPTLTVLADNVPVATRQTSNTFEELEATIPARTGHVRGVTLALAVSNTFIPGPSDGRALGVQVDRISVEPATVGAFPPRRTVAAAALGSAVFGAVFGLLAATATTAVGAATLVAVAQATVLRIGLGPFAPWLALVEALAASIGIGLLVVALVVERRRHERLRHTARFALMFTGAALYLHLLVLLHPDKLLAGAISHAARLSLLTAGAISYPSAFYVAALPFAHLAADRASLLWIVAAVAEAISFLFLYWMIVRGTGDRILAAIAVAVVQLLPIGFQFMAEARLTAVFGQAVTLVAMSLATAALLDGRRWQFWATGVAALVAFLSDAGTFITLASTLAASTLLLIALGSRNGRRAGIALGITLVAAAVLAAAIPSERFAPVAGVDVRLEVKVGPAPSPELPHPGAEAPLSRAADALGLPISCFGWPFLLLAVMGIVVNLRTRQFDDWWLLVWGWLLATVALIAVNVFRGGDVARDYYAAMPSVAVFAATGVVTLWNAGGQRRALAVATSALGAAIGVIGWLGVLGPALE